MPQTVDGVTRFEDQDVVNWFLVDTEGTHWHGRDPALDEQWLRDEKGIADGQEGRAA